MKTENKNLVSSAVGVALSLLVLYGTVWVIGKAWSNSKK